MQQLFQPKELIHKPAGELPDGVDPTQKEASLSTLLKNHRKVVEDKNALHPVYKSLGTVLLYCTTMIKLEDIFFKTISSIPNFYLCIFRNISLTRTFAAFLGSPETSLQFCRGGNS